MEETKEEINDVESTTEDSAKLPNKKKRIIITISIIAIILIIGIFASVFGSKEKETKEEQFSAWSYARAFLAQYVKFPDTLTVLNKTEEISKFSDYDLWSYRGDFKAENAYGMKVRHNFIVVVKVVNVNNTQNVYKYYLQVDGDVYYE